jgi:hypothetical protein
LIEPTFSAQRIHNFDDDCLSSETIDGVSFVLSYPVTRYKPSPIVDLCTKAERERLSPPAIKAFLKIRRDQIRMTRSRFSGQDLVENGKTHSGAHQFNCAAS